MGSEVVTDIISLPFSASIVPIEKTAKVIAGIHQPCQCRLWHCSNWVRDSMVRDWCAITQTSSIHFSHSFSQWPTPTIIFYCCCSKSRTTLFVPLQVAIAVAILWIQLLVVPASLKIPLAVRCRRFYSKPLQIQQTMTIKLTIFEHQGRYDL